MSRFHWVLLILGAALLAVWLAAAILAPLVAASGGQQASFPPFLLPGATTPLGGTHWLGTDLLGRDVLSRVLSAASTSLFVSASALALAYAVTLPLALVAAFGPGRLASTVSAVSGVCRPLPVVVLYLLLVVSLWPYPAFLIAVAIASLPGIFVAVPTVRRYMEEVGKERGKAVWNGILLWGLRDTLRRLVLVMVVAEGLGAVGLWPLPPPENGFGASIREVRQLTLVFPHLPLAYLLASVLVLLGLNAVSSSIEPLVPEPLRKLDPASPHFGETVGPRERRKAD